MTLDELYENLPTDVEGSVDRMRQEEAETERKFPGYPPYVSEVVLQKIEGDVNTEVAEVMAFLTEMFGRVPFKETGYKIFSNEVRFILERLAKNVAHHAAGHMAVQSAHQAQRASHNMLMGTLAGIALGSKKNNTQTEGTTDAGTES